MISYEEALTIVLGACRATDVEHVARDAAHGRVLAAEIRAERDVPPWATSAMDGVAVRIADLGRGPLPLDPLVAAGTMPGPIGPGRAVAIATGAPVPAGADRVAPVEDIRRDGDLVDVPVEAARAEFVRAAGSDLPAGALALSPGARLGPAEGALLAALGVGRVPVRRRPRVSILATGAELVAPDAAPGPAQIRDANSTGLAWACASAGAHVTSLGIVDDTPEATRAAIARALDADLVLTTGGVSVGDRDLVREALRDLGAEELFWRVALRPGKPCTCMTRGATVILGLPGNPASAMVGVALFVLPAIAALSGDADPAPRRVPVTAAGAWPAPAGRLHAVRCRVRAEAGALLAEPTGDQSSHRIGSLVGADALALVPPEAEIRPGDALDALPLGGRTVI